MRPLRLRQLLLAIALGISSFSAMAMFGYAGIIAASPLGQRWKSFGTMLAVTSIGFAFSWFRIGFIASEARNSAFFWHFVTFNALLVFYGGNIVSNLVGMWLGWENDGFAFAMAATITLGVSAAIIHAKQPTNGDRK